MSLEDTADRVDLKYENSTVRGLSILLGRKDIQEHILGLTADQQRGISAFFGSSRDAAIRQLRLLGTLLSGYDENYDDVSTFDIGWLVQSLADEADAGDQLSEMAEAALIVGEEPQGGGS